MNKYGNKKCEFNGLKFDSKAEMQRFKYLHHLQQIGVIHSLTVQPKFLLQQAFERNGVKHQAEHYVADFRYILDYQETIEDVKGMATPLYMSKRKRFLFKNEDIEFLEVRLKGAKWEVTKL